MKDPDFKEEFARAKHMADVMDIFIKTLEPKSTFTTDTNCCRCGKRIVVSGRQDPSIQWVCRECATPDQPSYKPDTGW